MDPPDPDVTASPTAQAFLARLLEGDEGGAEAVLRQARRGDPSAIGLYTTVKHALRTVGRLWELNEISVADEHMATEITTLILDRLESLRPSGVGPAIVVARPEHDAHALGERAVGSAFSDAGWTPVKLGAVEPEALAWVVAARRPSLVALSVKLPHQVPEAAELVLAVSALPDPPPVLVGGEGADPLLKVRGAARVDDDLASALAWAEAHRG